MSEQANESGENVSVIQLLAARAQDLGRSVDNWNTAYIVLVAFTVVLAAGVFIAQFVVIKKSKLLTSTQADLMAEKDRQSAADSKDKDVKIADAKQVAEVAKETAEKERLARIIIEERLAWRRITPKQPDKFVSALKPYAGSFVKISGMGNGDLESETFAKDIAAVLKEAGWDAPSPDFTNIRVPAPIGLNCRVDEHTDAGKALAKFLIELPTAEVTPTSLNGGMVAFITVGLRPPP
jgi:hypothetical protein